MLSKSETLCASSMKVGKTVCGREGLQVEMNTCGGHFDFLKEAKLVYKHCFIGRNIFCNFGEGSYFRLWPRKGTMKKKEMAVAAIFFSKGG